MKIFDKTMIIAICIMITISFCFLFLSEETAQGNFSTANITLSYLTAIIWDILLIVLIRTLRGNKVMRRKKPDAVFKLNVWGYIWRGELVLFLSMFLAVILVTVFRINPTPSILYTIILTILGYLSSVLITWLIFSTNRTGQVRLIFSLVRGY